MAYFFVVVCGTRFSYSKDISNASKGEKEAFVEETSGFPDAKEALDENIQKFTKSQQQIASMITSIDDKIKHLNNDDEKKRNNPASYKQVYYPNLSAAGMLVGIRDFETEENFDSTIKKLEVQGPPEKEVYSADEVVTFNPDYTGQVKQIKHDEYREARWHLEKEYVRISQIESRMRALQIKKDSFKRNIALIKEKSIIDKEAMKRMSAIMEKKINSLNKITKEKELLSEYQRGASNLFDKIYQTLLTKEKSSKILAKNTINYDSIQTMSYNKESAYVHFAEFRRRADEFVSQAFNARVRKIKYQTADDYRGGKDEVRDLDAAKAKLIYALSNYKVDFLMSIRGKKRSNPRDEFTPSDVFYHIEKIGLNSFMSNLNDWMDNVRENINALCDNFARVINLKIEMQESMRVEKYFEKLNKKLYSTDVSLLTNEYESLCANAEKFFKEREEYIENLANLSVGNNRILEDVVHNSESKIEEYSETLKNIREKTNESFGLSNDYHTIMYSLQDLLDIITNNKMALLDEETQKMRFQKELFIRKQRYDMFAEVFKLEEGFYDKYRMFLNNKRAAVEAMTGESEIAEDENIQTGYDIEEEIDIAVRKKMEILYRSLNACLETINYLYENKDRLTDDDAPAVNEALGQIIVDFDFLLKSVKIFDKRIDVIVENFIRADSHGFLRETFNSEMATLQHEEDELSRCVSELNASRARINNAFKIGTDNLVEKVDVLKKTIAERSKVIKDAEKKFLDQLEKFRTKNLLLKDLTETFNDYMRFKKELDEGYKNLVKEYSDLEQAGLDDWKNIKLEELSLETSRENSIKKIGALQSFLNSAVKDIMMVIPKDQTIQGNATEAFVKGYRDAKKF